MSQQALIVRGEYRSESLMNLEEVAHTGGVINIWARARWPETSREASRRTRDRSGRNARSGSCVIITAEGNGKRCGQLSWEEVQELTASSRGLLTGLTFGAFPDAVRWCSTVWMTCTNNMQLGRTYMVQLEAVVLAACTPQGFADQV